LINFELIQSVLTGQTWLAILSSSVISGILGALIAGGYTLKGKQNEYINDYYKTIIQRRIAAYEQLERLIVWLKITVNDDDYRPYHILFSDDDDSENIDKQLLSVMSQCLWYSEDTFKKTQELINLIFSLKPDNSGIIEFGKQNYKTIATLRVDLEKNLAIDMLKLLICSNFTM
jgi:hypothetical protein